MWRDAIVALLALGAAASQSWNVSLHAQSGTIVLTPTVGVTPPVTIVNVNVGPGHQYDPHVSGDVVSYTDQVSPATIRYFRFSTTADTEIPRDSSLTDLLSDVSGNRILFSRALVDRFAIMLFDPSTSQVTEVLPTAGSNRLGSAIGGNTVAMVDFKIGNGLGDIIIHDLTSNRSDAVSTSADGEQNPNVAPNGNTVVWERCASLLQCDVLEANWNQSTGGWTVASVSATPDSENNPDTDGTWIVYDATVTGNPTARDIYFRPVSGGPIRQLSLAGQQDNPSVRNGVISFTGTSAIGTDTDLFVYIIATNSLYEITTTASLSETLADLDVLAGGEIRLVWNTNDGPGGERNVYATTVTLPLTTTTYQTCLLYDDDLVKKRGSAFPIKLQLCDGIGNNLSSPSLALHARSVTQVSTNVDGPVDTTGNANPDADFRYDAALAGYIFNLSTKGLSTGTYKLNFTVGSDPTLYSVPFAIK